MSMLQFFSESSMVEGTYFAVKVKEGYAVIITRATYDTKDLSVDQSF
jgi:hypothetical protein